MSALPDCKPRLSQMFSSTNVIWVFGWSQESDPGEIVTVSDVVSGASGLHSWFWHRLAVRSWGKILDLCFSVTIGKNWVLRWLLAVELVGNFRSQWFSNKMKAKKIKLFSGKISILPQNFICRKNQNEIFCFGLVWPKSKYFVLLN